jgi:hypothetical protein
LIEKLKSLQLKRDTKFKGFDELEQWADNVEPLLSFSPKYEDEFKSARLNAVAYHGMNNDLCASNNMGEAIGGIK